MADIVLGYSLTHHQVRFEPSFWLLLGSSTLLYWSGMIWNDVFDIEQDRVERPNRPIPSGAVSVALAKSLGVGCMAAGVLLAALVPTSGKGPFAVSVLAALAVIVFVLAYDGPGKRTRVGPLLMGLCRGSNVMLGASLFPLNEWPQWLSMPQIGCAAGLTLYIAGVTWFARSEARQSSQWGLAWGQFICNIAIGLLVWMIGQQSGTGSIRHSLMLMAVVAISVNVRATAALLSPTPARVQLTVKSMLISYVLLDAALVYWQTGDPKLAIVTVALVVPALFLSRIIPMT